MNITSIVTDNISEMLVKILKFTQLRQKTLLQNINQMHNCGYMPEDLPVEEFSDLLNHAIAEYAQNQRLVFYDTENIKFEFAGTFEVKPLPDEHAEELLKENSEKYLKLQVDKLLENSLNQKAAVELLKQQTPQGEGAFEKVFDCFF